MRGSETYAGASPSDVRTHYEAGTEFYQQWLDPSLTYSCALWDDADSLEAAQARKLDYLLEAANARGAGRLLDIGCGWGSLMRRAVDHHGVESAAGLTLSEDQANYVRGWNDPRCQIHLVNWADYEPDEPFDAIVSAGAFEHFAKFGLRRKQKVAAYRNYFEYCHRILRPGASMALQTVAQGNSWPEGEQDIADMWAIKQMFPDSMVPRFAEIVHATEKLFDIRSVRIDPEHYARTCEEWLHRLRSRRNEAARAADPHLVGAYERYLEACVRQHRAGHATLLRFGMRRV